MDWKILTFIMEEDKNKIRNQHVLLIFRHPSLEKYLVIVKAIHI